MAAASATSSPLRWGILGCANIAKKNVRSIASSKNNTVVVSNDRSHCQ
jgi:predicted dehydrogenase